MPGRWASDADNHRSLASPWGRALAEHRDHLLLGGVAVAAAAALLAGWLVLSGGRPADAELGVPAATASDAVGATSSAPPRSATTQLVVDVEGGVLRPGIHELPNGARVADAVSAAGGYSSRADLGAAAGQLNLAAPLKDGQQVYVPILGAGSSAGAAASPGGASGPLNLNRASAAELDALPGIGPATVQKVIAARTERPFATLDELVERKVLTDAQLAKIRDLVTVP